MTCSTAAEPALVVVFCGCAVITGASPAPEKHEDPNFPGLESVEYHEDEVTWTIKLKVPDDTAPGKKILRCQARYMICDAKTCSVPGRWTLPETELSVTNAKSAPPAAKSKRRN